MEPFKKTNGPNGRHANKSTLWKCLILFQADYSESVISAGGLFIIKRNTTRARRKTPKISRLTTTAAPNACWVLNFAIIFRTKLCSTTWFSWSTLIKQTLSLSKPSKNFSLRRGWLFTRKYLFQSCPLLRTLMTHSRKLFLTTQSMPSLVFGVEIIQVTKSATDSSELTIPLPRKDTWARQKVMMKILNSNLFFMWGTREVSISLPLPNL